MNKALVLKLAGSAAVLGATLVGCNPAAKKVGIASASASANTGSGASAAAKAEKALKAKDFATAITAAENAVAASPRDPAYRMLLGQSYLAGGRFVSAEAAFLDTLRLDSSNSRAALSLALSQIALGRPDLARETLVKVGGNVPVADHGLALALAGDVNGALGMLEPAAREETASAKTRQNLALAYALAGDWAKARAVAEQDVAADQVDRRLASWAAFAQPQHSWDQVAALLGVKATYDRGQPERLALIDMPAAETQLAAAPAEQEFAPTATELASAEPVEAAPEAAPIQFAQADPEPDAVPAAEATPVLNQVVFAARQEVVQPIPASLAHARFKPAREAVASRAVADGRFVVQLGAFSTPAKAEAAWKRAVARNKALAAFTPNGESFRSAKGTLHRVAAGGFASRSLAVQVCDQVRAGGGTCFVRANSGAAQSLWAQRLAGVRLASR